MRERVNPYEGVSIDVTNCADATEVASQTGLDRVIGFRPVSAEGNVLERYKAVWDDTHDTPLGAIVGEGFTPVQDIEALRLGESLVERGLGTFKDVQVVDGGLTMYLNMELPGLTFEIPESPQIGDIYEARLRIGNGHGGTKHFEGTLELYRLWCSNGCGAWNKHSGFRFRHSTNVNTRHGTAERILLESAAEFTKAKESLTRFALTPMNQRTFTQFAAQLITGKNDPDEALREIAEGEGRKQTVRENRYEILATLFHQGRGNHGRTALDAYNAVTEWNTWARGNKGDEDALLVRTTHGSGAQTPESDREAFENVFSATAEVQAVTAEVLTADETRRVEQRLRSNINGQGAKIEQRAFRLLDEMALAHAA